jgi:hypothetical protein
VVYAVWITLLIAGAIFLPHRNIGLFVAYAIVLGVVFFIVVFIKGEKPRWRWKRIRQHSQR